MTKKPTPPAALEPVAPPLPSSGGAYVFDGDVLRPASAEEEPPMPAQPQSPENV